MKMCLIEGCGKKATTKGACQKHYARLRPRDVKNAAAHKYARTEGGRWSKLNRSARSRGIEVTITFEDYKLIHAAGVCHYCNKELPVTGSGIDRIDSSIGYVLGNCVPCCEFCNDIKGHHLTSKELQMIVDGRDPNYAINRLFVCQLPL